MRTICQLLISISLIALCAMTTGCTSGRLAEQFAAFEKLGVTKAQVTGKFSSTTYLVTREAGVRKATFDHTNAWMPKVYFERETPVMLRSADTPISELPSPIFKESPLPEAPEDFVGPLPPPGLIVPPATPLSPTAGDLRRD
jgi:hypothetical protein